MIVGVHHTSLVKASEMHGALRQASAKGQVTWDEFDAATLDDCRTLGKVIDAPKKIVEPGGTPLFFVERSRDANPLYIPARADAQQLRRNCDADPLDAPLVSMIE